MSTIPSLFSLCANRKAQTLVQNEQNPNRVANPNDIILQRAISEETAPFGTHMVREIREHKAIFSDIFKKANPDNQDYNEALITACEIGNINAVKILLNRGADIDARNYFGSSGLLVAAMQGNEYIEVIEILLDRGADINARDNDGYTPLIWAGEYGNIEVFKLLLARGADINVRDEEGRTALMIAAERGRKEVVEVLQNKI